MKIKRLLTVILAILLATLPSCKQSETAPDSADPADLTETAAENPDILTNVYSETALPVDGDITPYYHAGYRIKEDKLSLISWKEVRTDEEYIRDFYLTAVDLETFEREDRLLKLDGKSLYPQCTLITDDAVYFITIKDSSTVLVKYTLADDSTTTVPVDASNPNVDTGRNITGKLAQDNDGYIYLAYADCLHVLNPDMTKAFEITPPDYLNNVLVSPSGEVYAMCGVGYNGKAKAYPIDKKTKTLGSSIEFPEFTKADEICFGEGYDCFFRNAAGLYGYNFGAESAEMLVNWQNSGVDNFDVNEILVCSPELILAVYSATMDTPASVSVLNKADDIDLSNITTLNAVYFHEFNRELPRAIMDYNKANRDVHVVGEDYSVYNQTDKTKAKTMLISEMLTGIYTPDIICLEYYSDLDKDIATKMIENGLYTDMYEFMENDPDIKKDDIMGAVKNTFEVDGTLLGVMPTFAVKTLIAPKSAVGDMTSWNYTEVFDFIDSLPEGKKLSENTYETLNSYRAFETFIDYKAKTCDFDNPTCVELIEKYAEFHKYFGGKVEEPGEPVCREVTYRYIDSYYWDEHDMRTKDIVRIGYPVEQGNGSIILDGDLYIIPKNAPHPKEAWEFIRSLILNKPEFDEYGRSADIRMLRSQNESYAGEMKKYFKFFPFSGPAYCQVAPIDYLDQFIEDNGGDLSKRGTLVLYNEDEYKNYLDFIDTVGSPLSEVIPNEITDIIKEELSTYENTSRTAEETAKILQSRVSIYLSERE